MRKFSQAQSTNDRYVNKINKKIPPYNIYIHTYVHMCHNLIIMYITLNEVIILYRKNSNHSCLTEIQRIPPCER